MSHPCPQSTCKTTVADAAFACRAHWFELPLPLREAIVKAWDHGRGRATIEHTEAMIAAVQWWAGR